MRKYLLAAAVCLALSAPNAVFAQEPLNLTEQAIADFFAQRDVKRKQVSAENGDPYSMVWLADEIQKQIGGEWITAEEIVPFRVKMYMGAIQAGYVPAYDRMAKMVLEGRLPEGTKMDALDFYRQGAELGDVDAIIGYARMAQDEFICSICSKDDEGELLLAYDNQADGEKRTLMELAAASRDKREAAARTYQRERFEFANTAIALLSSDAAEDDSHAQDRLARIYLNGIKRPALTRYASYESGDREYYILRPEPAKAKPILERMAAKNDRPALQLLADLYLVGSYDGFPQDRTRFIKYASQAADGGDMAFAYKLGHAMVAGQPFGTDFDIGAKYLYMAHQAGRADATLDLAFMFSEGRGVPQNMTTSLALFEEAANRGSAKAAQFLADYWREGMSGTINPLRASVWQKKADELKANEARGAETMELMKRITNSGS